MGFSHLSSLPLATAAQPFAHSSDAALEKYLSRINLVSRTSKALTRIAELRAALVAVRRLGYAIVDQELELGLRSIAVPVFDRGGRVVASLNAGTSPVRVTLKELTQRLLPELKRSAADLQTAI